MAEEIKQRTMNTRISHKHDSPGNWEKADATDVSEGFIPCVGELIIYDAEDTDTSVSPRRPNFKIGDGIHNVNDLPFMYEPEIVFTNSNAGSGVSLPGFKRYEGVKLRVRFQCSTTCDYFKLNGVNTPICNSFDVIVAIPALCGTECVIQYVSEMSCYKVIEQKPLDGISTVGICNTSTATNYNGSLNNKWASTSTNGNTCLTSVVCGTPYITQITGSGGVSVSSSRTGLTAGTDKKLILSGTPFIKSGSTARMGMVPAPPTTAGTSLFLREDGTWASPSTSTLGALSVGSASKPVYFSNGTPVEANRIPTIRTGNSIPDGTVGEDGDMFIVTHANRLPRIYSGTEEPDYSIGVNGDIYIRYS